MRGAVVRYWASHMQDFSQPLGARGRVGYRHHTGVTALPSRDGQHTNTVLPREGLRPIRAALDGSRGGGRPWTVRPSPTRCGTTGATRAYGAAPAAAAPPGSVVRTPEAGAAR